MPGNFGIFRLSALQRRDDRFHRPRILCERLVIIGDQLVGNLVIDKLHAEIGAVVFVPQIAHPHIAGIVGIGHDNFQIAAALSGQIAGAVGNPG